MSTIYQMNLAQTQRVVFQNMLSSLVKDESLNIPVNTSGYRILYIDWIPKLDRDLHVHPSIQRMFSFIFSYTKVTHAAFVQHFIDEKKIKNRQMYIR